jgi:hypothetical protein
MYNFNAGIVEYLRKELGCKQLINCGNWRGPDPVLTQDAEYWSYSAAEVMGKNLYVPILFGTINANHTLSVLWGKIF